MLNFFVTSSSSSSSLFVYTGCALSSCGLLELAHTWDGKGCEFDSWQCRIYIISHVHKAYDYLSFFRVLWVHNTYDLIQKLCLKKEWLSSVFIVQGSLEFLSMTLNLVTNRSWLCGWAGCVALCYDCFSEKPKLSNVELG